MDLNGQPIDKLQFNRDNFQRLKDAYREVLDLLVVLQAREKKAEAKPKPAAKKPVSK